jgi:hypothetical protein
VELRQDKSRFMSVREIFRGFPFGSRELDSIGKGVEMVQTAKMSGRVFDAEPRGQKQSQFGGATKVFFGLT